METQQTFEPFAVLFDDLLDRVLRMAMETRYEKLDQREIEDLPSDRRAGIEEITDYDGNVIGYQVPVKRKFQREIIYLSVDAITRNYGGPEEGGWWYDEGEAVEQHAIVVRYTGDGMPHLDSFEQSFLASLAENWFKEYDFSTNYQSSVRPRGHDYRVRVGFDPEKSWSDYHPYC